MSRTGARDRIAARAAAGTANGRRVALPTLPADRESRPTAPPLAHRTPPTARDAATRRQSPTY